MNADKIKCGLTQIIILSTCYLLLTALVYAKPVSSTELIEKAQEYDGQAVVFQGEVVGDIMRRGDFAWINVHDGSNALGIWAKSPLTPAITFTGGYKSTGDIIEAQGTFHRACLEHGGDLDIHADSLNIIKRGQQRAEVLHLGEKKLVFLLAGVTLCLLILRLLLKIWKKR